jgi:hypothetical protein
MKFQRAGCYDLLYLKTKEIGWKENHGIQNSGTEDSKGNIIVASTENSGELHDRAL